MWIGIIFDHGDANKAMLHQFTKIISCIHTLPKWFLVIDDKNLKMIQSELTQSTHHLKRMKIHQLCTWYWVARWTQLIVSWNHAYILQSLNSSYKGVDKQPYHFAIWLWILAQIGLWRVLWRFIDIWQHIKAIFKH